MSEEYLIPTMDQTWVYPEVAASVGVKAIRTGSGETHRVQRRSGQDGGRKDKGSPGDDETSHERRVDKISVNLANGY